MELGSDVGISFFGHGADDVGHVLSVVASDV